MGEFKIWRSLLFIPANNWKMLNKAATEDQDAVLIDLEDACPVSERETGRVFARDIASILKAGQTDVLVRVNALPTGVTEEDLSVVLTDQIDGVMLPKTEGPGDILQVQKMIETVERKKGIHKKITILPLIESPKGVINAYEISRTGDRVAALCFGAGDFMRELGEGFTIARMSPEEYFPVLMYARSRIATAACATGIPAIDTPFFGLLIDTDGLTKEATKAKLLGFKGKMLTHPRHIAVVNRVFSPSEEDVAFSNKMVSAYTDAAAQGKGAAVLDGKMIDVAMYRMGTEVLAKAKKIREKADLCKVTGKQTMWIPGH